MRSVMQAVIRRTLDVAAHWPGNRKLGPAMIPPFLAAKHGYRMGDEPSDALLEDLARHFSLTVYHHTCTCRIGEKAAEMIAAEHGVKLATFV